MPACAKHSHKRPESKLPTRRKTDAIIVLIGALSNVLYNSLNEFHPLHRSHHGHVHVSPVRGCVEERSNALVAIVIKFQTARGPH
jgi:hypothetical protein